MIRRVAAAASIVLVGLLAGAPAAWAGESIGSGSWAGSTLAAEPCDASFCGLMTRTDSLSGPYSIKVAISMTEKEPVVCDTPTSGSASGTRSVPFEYSFACNGVYVVSAQGTGVSPAGLTSTSEVISREVTVANPAPTVSGVTAAADGRAITVSWDDMRTAAPDVEGYVVTRRIGDGDPAEVLAAGPDVLTMTDTDLPTAAGDATYAVFAIRPTPSGPVRSTSGTEATASYTAAPTGTTTPGSGGAGSGGSGTGSGTGTSTGSGGGTATGSGASGGSGGVGIGGRRVTAPRLGIAGTFLPPLLRPPTPVTTTTLDTGYEETLPYDPQGALPDEEASPFLVGEQSEGGGMVIPIATGLVLAVWAFHLRYLARVSRPIT